MPTSSRQLAGARRVSTLLGAALLALSAAACSSGTPTTGLTPTRLAAGDGTTGSSPPQTRAPERTSPVATTPPSTTVSPSRIATAPARTATSAPKPTRTVASAPKPGSATKPVSAPKPVSATKPVPAAKPAPAPVIILQPGSNGPKVRNLQGRLRQLQWFSGDVSDHYGSRTTAAVKGFQAKRGLAANGVLDEQTWNRVLGMSRPPTKDELANVKPKPPEPKPTDKAKPVAKAGGLSWDVDERCLTGRAMCISKGTNMLTWVVNGVPQYQFAVRFGSEQLPTREGTFAVTWKKVDVISNLYHTPMPYSMFFSGGQAVHYSSNFARLGYNGSSHGCVNVRDWNGIVRLYQESRVGDKVVVHW